MKQDKKKMEGYDLASDFLKLVFSTDGLQPHEVEQVEYAKKQFIEKYPLAEELLNADKDSSKKERYKK